MKRFVLIMLASILVPACLFAVDGVVLINQATVIAAGGFPFIISQPGSYRLSGNLQAKDKDTDVIIINVDNVTIDLNGFSMVGPSSCSGGFPCTNEGFGAGIRNSRTRFITNITIRNGTIQGMGGAGITIDGDNILVEYMHIADCGGDGISVAGNAIAQRNTADRNDGFGIRVGVGVIAENTATSNSIDGINCSNTGTISRNVARFNRRFGISSTGNPGGVNYVGNAMSGNFVSSIGGAGVNQGQNVCNNVPCPGAAF